MIFTETPLKGAYLIDWKNAATSEVSLPEPTASGSLAVRPGNSCSSRSIIRSPPSRGHCAVCIISLPRKPKLSWSAAFVEHIRRNP